MHQIAESINGRAHDRRPAHHGQREQSADVDEKRNGRSLAEIIREAD
jgi:hypothetical protein